MIHLFFYEYDWGGERAGTWADDALIQHFLNERSHSVFVGVGVAVGFDIYGGGVRDQGNVMVMGAVRR